MMTLRQTDMSNFEYERSQEEMMGERGLHALWVPV